ncbi:sialic acid synthase-like [Oppia nitens]|uniref:sialic acid synthase-like n=1 Tax=Oppia nitens TaxID=1686743 RepID=UPI0023DC6322|nr:sialic acid synthase-like [Oppia nitens]
MFELFGDSRRIGSDEPCFVVAECGQNHNGDIDLAIKMINECKHTIGADCVKFQKSNLNAKFNAKALNRPYNSIHSWGKTYGDHKRHLEFTNEQFIYLRDYARNEGILFTASAMDSQSLKFLAQLDVPFIKIGSGDVDNYPMLELAANYNKPLFVSTGMHDLNVVKTAYNLISTINSQICLLHCVSTYPTPYCDINLKVITDYQHLFPDAVIGYSGHEIGVEVSLAAVTLGAKVLERHLTLDKTMKGTDHSVSLEPQEFRQMITQIRNIESALSGHKPKYRQESEWMCYRKLGKSVVAKQFLPKGSVLTLDLIDIKVAEPFGINAYKVFDIIGKILNKDVDCDESIQFEDLSPNSE